MPSDISLAILARNEEHQIQSCISSAHDVVGEVVVLDTGSEDNTVDVAQKTGARVFHFPWEDDFAAARNRLISHCTGRWILMLDADEMLENPDHEWWQDESKREQADAWWCTIYNERVIGGRDQSYQHRLPRLFRNSETLRFKYPVHENLTLEEATTAEAPIRIKHSGYNLGQSQRQRKEQRNLRLLEKRLEQYPDDAHTHYYFAEHYARNRDAQMAYQHALKSLNLGVDGSARLMCLRIAWRYTLRYNKLNDLKLLRDISPGHEKFPELLLFEALAVETSSPENSRKLLERFLAIVDQLGRNNQLHRTDTILPETHREALELYCRHHIDQLEQSQLDKLLNSIQQLGGPNASFLILILKKAIKLNNKAAISVTLGHLNQTEYASSTEVQNLIQQLQQIHGSLPQSSKHS